MSVNDIINRHKKHLTNAQVHSLVKLSNEYKQLNAGRRAEAYGDLYTNHQDFRRGLQNMGLASRRGNIISGREVMGQVRVDDAYHRFNDQLNNIEDRMLDNAAGNMRAQNIARQQAAQRRNFVDNLADQIKQQYAAKKEFNENAVDPRIGNMPKPTKVQPQKTVPQVQGDIDPRFAQPVSAPDKANMTRIIPQARTAQRTANVQDAVAQARYNANKAANPAAYAALEVKYATKQKALADNTARWDREIADGDKIAKDDPEYKLYKNRAEKARKEKANAQSSLYRTQLAVNLPADVGTLVAADDADFAVRYDAAQKAAEKAQKAYSEYKEGGVRFRTDSEWIKAHTDALKSGNIKTALEDDYKRTQTVLARFEQAKAYRTAYSADAFYYSGITASKDADKYTSMRAKEGQYSNNIKAYDDEHGTQDSKYAAIINEFSRELPYNQRAYKYTFRGKLDGNDSAYSNFLLRIVNDKGGSIASDEPSIAGKREKTEAVLISASYMTDDERAKYNTILAERGAKEADKYFDYLYNNVLPGRVRQAIDEDYDAALRRDTIYDENGNRIGAEDGKDTWLAQIGASGMSVPVNIMEGVTDPLGTITTKQRDPVAARFNAMRGSSAQGMRNAVQENMGEFGQFAYGTGMSMVDSAVVAAISGGIGNAIGALGVPAAAAGKIGSALGGSILGGSAFNSAYSEAIDRGLSPDKARATALGQGINEMLFEAVSLDLVVSHFQHGGVLKVAKNRWVNWAVNAGVSAGVEGSEELTTDVANELWDKYINGIYSEELTKLREYIGNGMSYEDAKAQVQKEFDAQLGMSFLGGAVSGGIMGGGASILGTIYNRDNAKFGHELRKNTRVMDELKGFDYKSETAQDILTQSKLTDEDVSDLFNIRQQELLEQNIDSIKDAVKNGTITQEDADLLNRYKENGVQIVKDGKVTENENGITAEEYNRVQEILPQLQNGAEIQFLNNEEMREMVNAVGGEVAAAVDTQQTEIGAAERAFQEQRQAIEADETLSDEVKNERIQAAEQTRDTAVESAKGKFDKAMQTKKTALQVDGNTVKVAKGSGTVTFDFSTRENNGKVTLDTMTRVQRSALSFAKMIAEKYGVNMKVVQETVGRQSKNGEYDPETNTITVNLSGSNSAIYTMSHELTHWLKEQNEQGYTELRNAIKEQLERVDLTSSELPDMYNLARSEDEGLHNAVAETDTLWEGLCKYEKERYAKSGIILDDAKVEDEVVARCCESFLASNAFVQTMAAKHFRTAKNIAKYMVSMQQSIAELQEDAKERAYFADESPEDTMLRQYAEINRIANMWTNAVNNATKERKTEASEKKASISVSDKAYSDLAEKYKSGNATGAETEALRKMVDAAAKRAGYSARMYHGTRFFGFTKFDLTKGEQAIFATNDIDVAKTYSGETERNRISESVPADYVDSLDASELLMQANDHLNGKYSDFKLLTQQQKNNSANAYRITLDAAVSHAEAFYAEHDGAFSKEKEAIFKSIVDDMRDMAKAKNDEELSSAYASYENHIWDFKWMDESLAYEFTSTVTGVRLLQTMQSLSDMLYKGNVYSNGNRIVFDNQLALELDAELHKGVYSLYGREGKSLVIDADGANWNQIKAPEELHLEGPQRTRAIADKAFALGYDSVLIKNVYDNGGETTKNKKGDVYIFNAKNAVKSADLVTYDDKGNIIPLSERFNKANDDIRYSVAVEDMNFPALSINDSKQAFTDEIFNGTKDIETRTYPIPKRLVGTWVPIVRTGKGRQRVVGYVKFSGDKLYHNSNEFRADYNRHRVAEGSEYDIAGEKYGWIISDVMKLDEPIVIGTKGFTPGEFRWRDLEGIVDNPNDHLVTNKSGEPVMNVTDNGNSTMLSLSTYEKDGRAALDEYLQKRVADGKLDAEGAEEIKKQMNAIYDICKEYEGKYVTFGKWSQAAVQKGENGLPVFSVIRDNAEYPMNLDFSLVCVKRRALDAVLNQVIRSGQMERLILDDKALVNVNEIIKKHGFETACAMCFVEAKRFRQTKVADTFVNMYNDLVKSLRGNDLSYFNFGGNETIQQGKGITNVPDSELNWSKVDALIDKYNKKVETTGKTGMNVPTAIAFELKNNPESRQLLLRGDFMSTAGFDAVAERAPSILKLYNKKKGTGGPKASFGDMQYLNDIETKSWTPERAYAVGGVRVQSFSDFVPRMFFDYAQMMADLAAGKLPAHAYTKEESFAKLFGLTGMKINLSLIPKVATDGLSAGLQYQRDKNGDVVYKNGKPVVTYAWAGESFNYDVAKQIQEDAEYGKNCGTICIGVSDEHIRMMMDDPTIRMIIPYHKSSLNPVVAKMEHIDGFTDYSKQQRTYKDGKAVKVDFGFNQRLHELGDPKAVSQEYLDWCKENGYTPKFEKFAYNADGSMNENYYKLLEDFALYDEQGTYQAQGAVKMVYPSANSKFGSLYTILKDALALDDSRQEILDARVSSLADEIVKASDKWRVERQVEAAKSKKKASLAVTDSFTESEYFDEAKYAKMSESERIEYRQRIAEMEMRSEARERQREIDRNRRYRSDITKTLKKGTDRIVKLLANPTEKAHVPIQFAETVAEYAMALNELLTKNGDDKQTIKGKLNAQKLLKAYNDAFEAKADIEQAQKDDPNYDPRGEFIAKGELGTMYNQELVDMINAMDEIISNKQMSELTNDELKLILGTMKGVLKTVQSANKLIGDTENRDIAHVGNKMAKETREAPNVFGEKKNLFTRAMNRYVVESLGLRRIAKIYSGSNENAEFVKLVDKLNQGAIEKERIALDLRNMFNAVTNKYAKDMKTWYGKNAKWIDIGNGVKITKGMRVALAMHILNEQNLRNIEKAGLRIPDAKLYAEGKYTEAYERGKVIQLTKAQAEQIVSGMTEAEKAYFEVAKEFFHKRSGYYINRTSLQLLGYRKANVENYFPIQTDDAYRAVKYDEVMQSAGVEHPGFLEKRKGTVNVMYLNDITAVVNRQIEGVSKYAGLAVPMRNWNAVMNKQLFKQNENGDWVRDPDGNVHNVLEQEMGFTSKGKAIVDYVDQFIDDLTTNVQKDANEDVSPGEIGAKLTSNYVKAVLLLNARVAVSQVASLPTAAAEIPWQYIAKAFKGHIDGHMRHAQIDALIDQYTPIFAMRRAGTQNEIADIMKHRGLSDKAEQKLPFLLGWITTMDTLTTRRLWYACEQWVKGETKIPVGSEAFYEEVAKRYERVIQNTQPNFTVLQRAPILRSKNPMTRILTMFGTQRMQNGGIFIEKAFEVAQSNKTNRKVALKGFGRALSALVSASVMLSVSRAIVAALRGRVRPMQDDDKKLTVESIGKYLGNDIASNLAGSFMFGSEIYDFVSGKIGNVINGDSGYATEFSLPAAEALANIITFFKETDWNYFKYMTAKNEDGSDKHSDHEKWVKTKSFINEIMEMSSYLTGLPLQNASKTILNGFLPLYEDFQERAKTGELNLYLHGSGRLDKDSTYNKYKEWTDEGRKGSTYLYWETKLKDVKGGVSGKSEVLWEDTTLSPEEKAILLRMMVSTSSNVYTNQGSVVYNAKGNVVADFSDLDAYRAASLGDAKYEGWQNAVELGVPSDYASTAFAKYTELRKKPGYNEAFREWEKMVIKSAEQRAILEMCVIGDDGSVKRYEYGKQLIAAGMNAENAYNLIEDIRSVKKADSDKYLKGLTDAQKKLIYEYKGWKYGK